MDNFDLKSYLSNNPLLNEIKVNPPSFFSQKDMEALDILIEYFGEGTSENHRDYPLSESYSLDNYEPDDDEYLAIEHLLKKTSNKFTHVIKDIFGFTDAPGAPKNAYYIKVTIFKDHEYVEVESPYLDNDGNYYMGWFGPDKKYYPDTTNFTEDGDYIGGAG
jgi:hypothetical protein